MELAYYMNFKRVLAYLQPYLNIWIGLITYKKEIEHGMSEKSINLGRREKSAKFRGFVLNWLTPFPTPPHPIWDKK